jgi:hypothetical protein
MAIRGLLGGTLFMTVGAIVPAEAQTPQSSSPPQAPHVTQVPGKTPQERCYYRYMTAHGYHHVNLHGSLRAAPGEHVELEQGWLGC